MGVDQTVAASHAGSDILGMIMNGGQMEAAGMTVEVEACGNLTLPDSQLWFAH